MKHAKHNIDSLMGKTITVYCGVYIYHGKLIDFDDNNFVLENPSIIYDTGPHGAAEYYNIQSLCTELFFINRKAVESFGVIK